MNGDSNLLNMCEKQSTYGDSYLYILAEEAYGVEEMPAFKIGIATHGLCDEGLQSTKKYRESPFPVSITRRIAKLQNGNPRRIVPLAYFRYSTDEISSGLDKSRKAETSWKRIFRKKAVKTHSLEWFRGNKEDLADAIEAIIVEESGMYASYWRSEETLFISC